MLKTWEQDLRGVLQKSDTPFLGLMRDAFDSEVRVAINEAIAVDRSVDGYIRLLYRYPALFSIHLAHTVMTGMGQTGNYDLYPHICAALQLNVLPTADEKEGLWSEFRRAVLKLGLEVSPRLSGHHYMADTYLRQAGVPLAFADDLAEKMLAFAKTAGIPDADDPDGIARWQAALELRLGPPFSRVAQKALAFDSQGFYTRCFIKVHEYQGVAVGTSPLEQAMARAFQKLPNGSHFRRAALPFLMLNNDRLGVFVPSGESGRTVTIDVDGESRRIGVGEVDEFFDIAHALPLAVSIRDSVSLQPIKYEVWGDNKPNRMLLFNETGRFKGGAQLGMAEALVLPPGRYTVLCRFKPEGIEVEELSESPRVNTFAIFIHPGQRQVFSNGPGMLALQGEGRPLAIWNGTVRGTKDAVEFFYGALTLELEFPLDWLALSARAFDIVLSNNNQEPPTLIHIVTDEQGRATCQVSETSWYLSMPPGLSRILAEVRRPGETRTLVRTSVLYWSGLESVSGALKFQLQSSPANLIASNCENFAIAEHLIQPKDNVSRNLSLTFQLDERRVQTLVWNAPGVFVEITRLNESGARSSTKRPLGSTEVVSLTSSNQIIVSSSESGELALGDWVQFIDFSRQTSKQLAASFLASHITSKSQTLTFRPAGVTESKLLLKLVQPHAVYSISDKVIEGQLVIKLESPAEIEAILVRAHDVLTGQDIEVELQANDAKWSNCRLGRARLMSLTRPEGGYVSHLYLAFELWTTGAWTFKFDGRISNLWGHLQNERLDQFAVGFICDHSGAQASVSTLTAELQGLAEKQSLVVFSRVNDELLPCYAEASWASIRWLAIAWRSLVDRWRGQEAAGISEFIDMACSRPAEDASSTWMPQQYIGAELPGIFALHADEYRKVNEHRHPLARSLRTIAQVRREYPTVFGALLHPTAAMGFTNVPAIMRGQAPRDFSLDAYCDALRQSVLTESDLTRLEDSNFETEAGDYLGPIHYRHANSRLLACYETTLDGNGIRRGQGINLCGYVRKVMPTLNGMVLKRLKGSRPHVDPWPRGLSNEVSEELAQSNENLANIQHFLSLLALHCRASARSSEYLPAFLSTLKAAGLPIEACLAYLLQIGDALFAYYLLLWEVVLSGESTS